MPGAINSNKPIGNGRNQERLLIVGTGLAPVRKMVAYIYQTALNVSATRNLDRNKPYPYGMPYQTASPFCWSQCAFCRCKVVGRRQSKIISNCGSLYNTERSSLLK